MHGAWGQLAKAHPRILSSSWNYTVPGIRVDRLAPALWSDATQLEVWMVSSIQRTTRAGPKLDNVQGLSGS